MGYEAVNNNYYYLAVRRISGYPVRGTMMASCEEELAKKLDAMDMELVRFRETGHFQTFRDKIWPRKIDMRDKIKFFVMMGRLMHAGVPLMDALSRVAKDTRDEVFKGILYHIQKDMEAGSSLSESFKKYPSTFSVSVVNMITAHEETGKLGEAFDDAAEFYKWSHELQRRIKKALRYPAMLLIATVTCIFFMMGVVVPEITGFVATLGSTLPFATTSLMAASQFFQDAWADLLIMSFLAFGSVKLLRWLSRDFRFQTDLLMTSLPYFGPLRVKMNTVRFLHTLGVLYDANVPILKCFTLAMENVEDLPFREAFRSVKKKVEAGELISEAMRETGYFTDTTIQMIGVGQESGQFSQVINQVVKFYNDDIDDEVDRVVGLIEPAISIVMALMIVWIAAGVFGPIYDSMETLKS